MVTRPDAPVTAVIQPHTGTLEAPKPGIATDQVVAWETFEPESSRLASCEHLLVMVGSNHVLPPDYIPEDLVYLNAYGIVTRGSEDMLRYEATVQLGRLLSAAASDGEEVLVASGYRSYTEQAGTFAWFREEYGEEAEKLSAPPGQSEHQLGTAVDFTTSEVGYELVAAFGDTSAGEWLMEHAAEYGFVLSYGQEETETGVGWEPWHYRYIGVEAAQRAKESGENLFAFLARQGVRHCYTP
jgi:D-alanyl-D-alanine carboxypeptidase